MQILLWFKGPLGPAPPHPGVAGSPQDGGERGGQRWAGGRGSPGFGRPGEESARSSHSRDTEAGASTPPAPTAEGKAGTAVLQAQGAGWGSEGAGREAGAQRGLQVPACPAALTRPLLPLKGSGNRSRRVAAAFALPPRLGGQEP